MDHRSHQRTASMVNLILGIWLIISPFIFGYAGLTSALWNNIIFGFLIALFGYLRMSRDGMTEWLSWANFIFGLWIIISPFFIFYPTIASVWNNIIVGAVATLLASISAMETHTVVGARRRVVT